MTQTYTRKEEAVQTVQEQAGKVLSQVAGFVGVRTMDIGLRYGLYEEISMHSGGVGAKELAERKNMAPFYVEVWCRSACAAETLEANEDGSYRLAAHMDKLLLNKDFPGYIGGMPIIMNRQEIGEWFAERLSSGEHIWWDQCSHEWIQAVSMTGTAFYNRLVPDGLGRIPGLNDRLTQDARILELACGAGIGLVKSAKAYPASTIDGLDGDTYSLQLSEKRLKEAGLDNRVNLIHSAVEDLDAEGKYDVVINNISMHECRDMEKATGRIYRALKPDGYFVVSDMPFPASPEGQRTVPGRIMCGVQFFEALIGDQLVPPQFYVDLLNRHGFKNVGTVELTPVHALVFGQR